MSADITAGPATGATSIAFPRHEQTFPTLAYPEIERMRRFGELRAYKDGEALFETGKVGPGMFVVLSGHVAITQRDGLGHVTPVIDQGPGQFLGRDRPALRPRRAGRRPCRGRRRNAADPAGPVARASGCGSRTRRAHHARADPAPGQPDPGRRRRPGADRPAFARRHGAAAEFPGAQRPAAPRTRSRNRQGRRRSGRALLALARRSAAGGVPRRHGAAQSVGDLAGAGGGDDHQPGA